jgi:hypothetical protein
VAFVECVTETLPPGHHEAPGIRFAHHSPGPAQNMYGVLP